jgi:uncharacterized protein
MNVDLLPIINNEGQTIDFSGTVDFTEGDVAVTAEVLGKAVNFAGRIDVTGQIRAIVKTNCARCLKPLEVPMELSVAETVGTGEEELTLDGTVLDVGAMVTDNIVVNLPIRYLCSEDCKGICSHCGADLNEGPCGCTEEEVDDRLSKLKDLLK